MTTLRDLFTERRERLLVPLERPLREYLEGVFGARPRIDRISVRTKGVQSFVDKAAKMENGLPKYEDPLNQIQDQLGARIVVFYKSDAEQLAEDVKKYFKDIEAKRVVPDSEREFGYEGIHFILFIPDDVLEERASGTRPVEFFELQIKTLFQHSWSEAEHDLGYKFSTELSRDQKRRLAFTAAQAWGADQVFEELHRQTTNQPR